LGKNRPDFDLIQSVVGSIEERVAGHRYSECSEAERTVCYVWLAGALIENGGFERLFEGYFDGDRDFVQTRKALERIGASAAHDAFSTVVRLFPDGRLHADLRERRDFWLSLPPDTRERLDRQYGDALDQVTEQLAAYVRAHLDELAPPGA